LKDDANEKLTGLSPEDLRDYAPMLSQSFTDEEWDLIDRKIDGHPQAFEFLCSLLRSRRKSSVAHLLRSDRITRYKDRILHELLDELLSTLDVEERDILDTVCLLRKPFTEEAAWCFT